MRCLSNAIYLKMFQIFQAEKSDANDDEMDPKCQYKHK